MEDKRKLVVLTGAGISAESGIQTFRGGNGLWDDEPVQAVASIDGWYADPERVINFYNKRRAQLSTVQPNRAHIILKELEERFNVTVVTQNVDNLHERAGSSHIIHLHGELTKVRPVDCYTDRDWYSERYVTDIGYEPIHMGDTGGPHNRQLRPHIVWFGEQVPNLELAVQEVSGADVLLIVGTSMQVYPAASLYLYVPDSCPVYMIDPDPAAAAHVSRVIHIQEKSTTGMERFREMVTSCN
ncbi:MAG: NAD-dependent protein deacylase [Bacteroidaceae bacterium]|nr:NAD-dependent protein deacylase [Bacteroidaceae bacterium]